MIENSRKQNLEKQGYSFHNKKKGFGPLYQFFKPYLGLSIVIRASNRTLSLLFGANEFSSFSLGRVNLKIPAIVS